MPDTYNDQNQLMLSLLCIGALVASAILYARVGTSNGYLDDNNSTDISNRSALEPNNGSLVMGDENSENAVNNRTKVSLVYNNYFNV